MLARRLDVVTVLLEARAWTGPEAGDRRWKPTLIAPTQSTA
jgi:hypothetical protein